MERNIIIVGLIALAVMVGLAGMQYLPTQDEAVEVDQRKLLYFHASWCKACDQQKPIVDAIQAKGYKVVRIDIDTNPELAQTYKIEGVPTIIILDKDGNEAFRQTGVVPFKVILKILKLMFKLLVLRSMA